MYFCFNFEFYLNFIVYIFLINMEQNSGTLATLTLVSYIVQF